MANKPRRVRDYVKTIDVPFATAILKVNVRKRDFDTLGFESGDSVRLVRWIETPLGTCFRIENSIHWVYSKDLKTFRYLPGFEDHTNVEIHRHNVLKNRS